MKIKSLVFAGVGIALLAGAGYAGSHWILGSELTPLAAAEVIPQEAFMTAYVSTDADNWQQLERVGIPPNLLQNSWKQTQQKMLADTQIDYAKDIQPWLGGMALAIIPNTGNASPQFLGVLGIKNKLKAYQFFKKIEKETKNLQKTEYRNITIAEDRDSTKPSYLAMLGNRVMFASSRKIIEKAIDTYKGSPSLADDATTKAAFTERLNLEHSLGQIYLTNYSSLMKSVSDNRLNNSPIVDEIEYAVLGIGAQGESLHGQSLTKLNSDRLTQGFDRPSGKLLAKLPENSITVVNGSHLDRIWTNATSVLAADPNLNGSLNMMRGGLQMAGVELERDIFGWMDGEYAFGLIPTQTQIIPELGFGLGGAMLLETQQSDVAKEALTKLENLLQLSMGLTPTETKINGKTMTQWSEPYSNFTLTYGWLDGNSLMLAVGDRVAESIGTKPLTKSDKFDKFAKQLPNKNLGYVYLDINPIAKIINSLPEEEKESITPETIELINSIDSIGGTSTMPNPTTIKGDIAISFKN